MKILLLGSTGSIGSSVIRCIERFPEKFKLAGIAANNSLSRIIEQAGRFSPSAVCLGSPSAAEEARGKLPSSVTLFEGENGLEKMVNETDFDLLLNALVGAVGFLPTVAALKRNKRVALANKESLVIGGEIIMQLIEAGQGSIIPVDSEHSAILQCLNGENIKTVESIVLTASGGPFRQRPIESFDKITTEDALQHPTWSMGKKITIDAATLMNKGFEVIEAHHIFGVSYGQLDVVIHPQSIIHSMVVFHDGAVIAQCGLPDMELPIQYALSHPARLPFPGKRLQLAEIGSLTFSQPDYNRFPCLKLCLDAGKAGGSLPTVLNAANEIAVNLFLKKKIGFTQIPKLIKSALEGHLPQEIKSPDVIKEIDSQTRQRIFKDILKTI